MPAEIRKKLGIGPGSVLEWDQQDDHVVVRTFDKTLAKHDGAERVA